MKRFALINVKTCKVENIILWDREDEYKLADGYMLASIEEGENIQIGDDLNPTLKSVESTQSTGDTQ